MLEKQLYEGMPPELIKENLRANSYKILAEETYMKPLTDEEITAHRASLTENYLRIETIKEEIKAYTDHRKAEMKPLESDLKESAYAVKTGQVKVIGDIYQIDDQENRLMGYYDETGRMISMRPLKPEERQTNFMSISRMNRAANDTDY